MYKFLLFLRRLDERQLLEEKKANLIDSVVSNIASHPLYDDKPLYNEKHKKFRWNVFKNKDPETLFDLFTKPQVDADNLTVFEHMKQLDSRHGKQAGVFAKYMKGATFMIPTPRHIIQMMVEMMEPKQDDMICDPACGSAGFLVASGEFVHQHHEDWFLDKDFKFIERLIGLISKHLLVL